MKVGGYTLGLILGLVAAIPFFFATGYVIGDAGKGTRPAVAERHWKHMPPQTFSAGSLVVHCTTKTSSIAFAKRTHAVAGDVFVYTCRAAKS